MEFAEDCLKKLKSLEINDSNNNAINYFSEEKIIQFALMVKYNKAYNDYIKDNNL